jgi:hypothetical protein
LSIHSERIRVQRCFVGIKCVHVAEISIAHTDDDDAKWIL